jgi:hypothetical protein
MVMSRAAWYLLVTERWGEAQSSSRDARLSQTVPGWGLLPGPACARGASAALAIRAA